MGDTRYTRDEEKFDYQNGADGCDSHAAGSDGRAAVDGFKKLALLLVLALVVFCFRSFVLTRVVVSGDSMNPSFSDGDVLWARKFGVDKLDRYQVVVANTDSGYVIKRVIGLPGEAVQIVEGCVYIDGEKLADDPAAQTSIYGVAEAGVTLGEDEYFLLGDNRDNSTDSRVWGPVGSEDIKGVTVFRFFPFWKAGYVKNIP